VSSFCNDVVGDISGIISGATGAVIISRIVRDTALRSMVVNLVVTGLIAALTIGGKAAGKYIAIAHNEKIIFSVGRLMSFFNILRFGGDK
jgi:CBS domain containing-hemolysin-like protein